LVAFVTSILSNLKNWRPLSLLNTGYKIVAKAMPNRLKKVLFSLIDNNQTGFPPKKYLSAKILDDQWLGIGLFPIGKGLRQRCPLFPLYTLCRDFGISNLKL